MINTQKVLAASLSVYKINNALGTSKIISGMQRRNTRMICNLVYCIIKLKEKTPCLEQFVPKWQLIRIQQPLQNFQLKRNKRNPIKYD